VCKGICNGSSWFWTSDFWHESSLPYI